MPDNKLMMKIGAVDDTQKARESAGKGVDQLASKIEKLSKAGMAPSGEFKALGKLRKEFKKIINDVKGLNKQTDKTFGQNMQRTTAKMSGNVETAMGVMAGGGEELVIASKLKEAGSFLQNYKKDAKGISETLAKGSKTFKDNMKASRNETKGIKDIMGSMRAGGSGISGMGGVSNSSGSAKGGGFGAMAIGGGVLAVAGGIISGMSKVGESFRSAALAQIKSLQITNTPALYREGYKSLGVTAAEKAASAAMFAKQTSGRTGSKNVASDAMLKNFAEIGAAYGIGPEAIGGLAGTMKRFGGGTASTFGVVGTAEKVGMGGARLPEFLAAFEGTLTSAVNTGMATSNDALLLSLGGLMNTSDERLKVLAPQIVQSSSQMFGDAARLKGGPGGSFAFQAIAADMREKGEPTSLFDIQSRLSEGATPQNLKAMVRMAKAQTGGDEKTTAAFLQQTQMFNKISDPRKIVDMINQIESMDEYGKSKSGADIIEELNTAGMGTVGERNKNMSGVIEGSLGRAVKDEMVRLSKTSELMKDGVDVIKDGVQKMVTSLDGIYQIQVKYGVDFVTALAIQAKLNKQNTVEK